MNVLTVSGSSGPMSSNTMLLDAVPSLFPQHSVRRFSEIESLPLFLAREDRAPWPDVVLRWRESVADCDAVVICTPEYLHNLPAILKNAFEWTSSSGDFMHKRVLAMTLAPSEPRGEKALESLLWTLQALQAKVVAQLQLYRDELQFDPEGRLLACDGLDLLRTGLGEIGLK